MPCLLQYKIRFHWYCNTSNNMNVSFDINFPILRNTYRFIKLAFGTLNEVCLFSLGKKSRRNSEKNDFIWCITQLNSLRHTLYAKLRFSPLIQSVGKQDQDIPTDPKELTHCKSFKTKCEMNSFKFIFQHIGKIQGVSRNCCLADPKSAHLTKHS